MTIVRPSYNCSGGRSPRSREVLTINGRCEARRTRRRSGPSRSRRRIRWSSPHPRIPRWRRCRASSANAPCAASTRSPSRACGASLPPRSSSAAAPGCRYVLSGPHDLAGLSTLRLSPAFTCSTRLPRIHCRSWATGPRRCWWAQGGMERGRARDAGAGRMPRSTRRPRAARRTAAIAAAALLLAG